MFNDAGVLSLEAEVGRMSVESGERAVHGRRGAEPHLRTHVVQARLTELTEATRHARLNGHTVTCRPRGGGHERRLPVLVGKYEPAGTTGHAELNTLMLKSLHV